MSRKEPYAIEVEGLHLTFRLMCFSFIRPFYVEVKGLGKAIDELSEREWLDLLNKIEEAAVEFIAQNPGYHWPQSKRPVCMNWEREGHRIYLRFSP